jgi:hypothetical protein
MLYNKHIKELKKQMQLSLPRQLNCSTAVLGGLVPSLWLAINSLKNDRTPEYIIGVREE